MSTIYYFTNSYPFGLGEDWKRNEIRILSKHFNKIEVIPNNFGGNKINQGEILPNVEYHNPLFQEQKKHSLIRQLVSILFCFSAFTFLKEGFTNKVFLNKIDFVHWAKCSYSILHLKRNKQLKIFISKMKTNDVAYFFWGRGTSEILALSKLNTRTIIRVHNYDLISERYNSSYLPFQFQQLKNVDLYVTISNHAIEYLNKKYPGFQQKIVLNRLGTSLTQESIDFVNKNKPFTIFTCSSLINIKRVNLLAHALANYVTVPIKWIHMGDGENLQQIQAIISGAPSNIDYTITGWITKYEMEKLYKELKPSLFINVSEMEGVPVSIMEACSHGTPILATNVGGNSEIVSSSNGKLIPENISAEKLANEILLFTQKTTSEIQQLSENSFQEYMSNYNSEINTLKFVDLINGNIKS